MRFADIPGHEEEKRRLREMADSGRIPHALLLEGPAGTGKFALARAFVQYIHCRHRTADGDSCGVCDACRQQESFNHIDTIYSFPVVKRKNSKVTLSDDYIEEFHEFMRQSPFMDFSKWLEMLGNINGQPQIYVEEGNELIRRLTFMTRRSAYKTAIMWLPERMMEPTANKLLKLIEEPFGDTILVFVSNRPRNILPTIYSRLQRVTVSRYSDSELAEILRGDGLDAATAADLARIAEGNVNEALQQSGVGEERLRQFELFVQLMRKAYARRVGELRKWSVEVSELGREGAMRFIDYMTRLLRESFLSHLADPRLLTMNRAELEFVSRFFPFINERNISDFCRLADEARRDIAANGNAKMIFFDMAVRAIMLIRR